MLQGKCENDAGMLVT